MIKYVIIKKGSGLGEFSAWSFYCIKDYSGQNTSAKLMLATTEERLSSRWLAVCALRIAWLAFDEFLWFKCDNGVQWGKILNSDGALERKKSNCLVGHWTGFTITLSLNIFNSKIVPLLRKHFWFFNGVQRNNEIQY